MKWSRIGVLGYFLQLGAAAFLTYGLARGDDSEAGKGCPLNRGGGGPGRSHLILLSVLSVTGTWVLGFAQSCMGSDVLKWRSLYAMEDQAWRAHYRETFSRNIRELLCCLGRPRFWAAKEDDDVDAVAALLGDLVAYRAVGASHLEVFAGLALLRQQPKVVGNEDAIARVPRDLIKEAAALFPFAVAAYTGPLLDIGRNPFTWILVWIHRQGVLRPWVRRRLPALEGDNLWRGHAGAFLRHLKLAPDCLRMGRVKQTKSGEAVFFVVVLHELRTVVIAVRGTETPEDLIIDGLGREHPLSESDTSGLLRSPSAVDADTGRVLHFAHLGVVSAARDLACQLDGVPEADPEDPTTVDALDGTTESDRGLLSKLLQKGGECEGYALRLVGHSMGGAVASLTGLRLLRRFPELHVYGYGTIPCVDATTAEACSTFVTTVVHNDEFASRLSVASVMRLRAAALRAVAADAGRDSAMLQHLTRRLLGTLEKPVAASRQLAQAGASVVESAAASVAQTVAAAGTAVGLGPAPAALPKQPKELGHIPKQWNELRIDKDPTAVEGLRTYSRADYGSLAEYSQAIGGEQLKDWQPEKPAKPGGSIRRQGRRHLLKNQIKGVGGSHGATREELEGLTAVFGESSGEDGEEYSEIELEEGHKQVGQASNGHSEGAVSHNDQYLGRVGPADVAILIDEDSLHQEVPHWEQQRQGSSFKISAEKDRSQVPALVGMNANGLQPRSDSGGRQMPEILPDADDADAQGSLDTTGFEGLDIDNFPAEVFVPGQVLHVVREDNESMWQWLGHRPRYVALIVNRHSLGQLVVSPTMFLDHLPWRCAYALNSVLKQMDKGSDDAEPQGEDHV